MEARRVVLDVVSSIVVLATAGNARAQCEQWNRSGEHASAAISVATAGDLGAGPELFAASFATVERWNGSTWQALPAGGPYARAMLVVPGPQPLLYVAGSSQTFGAQTIASFDGSAWSPLGQGVGDTVYALALHDDGTGTAMYVGGAFTAAGGLVANRIARWDGASWSPVGAGLAWDVHSLLSVPSGPLAGLYAGGRNMGPTTPASVARWDGATWTEIGPTAPSIDVVETLAVFDAGAGAAIYAGGSIFSFSTGIVSPRLARWNGTSWSLLSIFGVDGFTSDVRSLRVADLGNGSQLYVGGRFRGTTTEVSPNVIRYDGVQAHGVAGGAPHVSGDGVHALADWDDGSGHGPGLFVGGSFGSPAVPFPVNGVVLEGCRIASFCAGDGIDPDVTTPCPCGNSGAAGRGCAWSSGPSGALLAASGRIAPDDRLVLTASGMPAVATSTIFFKGDATAAGGALFGDGVRCVDGTLIRLGAKTNVSGSAAYPETGNASISVRGGTPVGSGVTATYQTSFRNAAAFCTPATFNATNGVRVTW